MTSAGRVIVAMSGGVDSSVAAGLLVEQGCDVVGITMHLADGAAPGTIGEVGTCCSTDDVSDARRVAEHLGIPHYVANYKEAFKSAVIDRFVADYQQGLTPSPCVLCNDVLKFKLLLSRARALGGDHLATGHYAQLSAGPDGQVQLRRGLDPGKDQSYFLFGVTQAALKAMLFPVGGLTKEAVRLEAERLGLPVAHKAESQDICFVPDGDYASFVERHAEPVKGEIVDREGAVLGHHEGVHRFTIGQRRGLGLGGGDKRFVIGISGPDGRIAVGPSEALMAAGLVADRCNWIGGQPPAKDTLVLARIRHRSSARPATVVQAGDTLDLRFAEPAQAVAPGQAVVLYEAADPSRVLGGGWIRTSLPAEEAA